MADGSAVAVLWGRRTGPLVSGMCLAVLHDPSPSGLLL